MLAISDAQFFGSISQSGSECNCQKYGLDKVPEHDTEVSRAISAHKRNTIHSKDVKMLAPPTATFELCMHSAR